MPDEKISTKKNSSIRKAIERRNKLLSQADKIERELKTLEEKIKNWSWELKGPLMYQYLQEIIDQIRKGKRPFSEEELVDSCHFGEIDRAQIKRFAEREARRQKFDRENQ